MRLQIPSSADLGPDPRCRIPDPRSQIPDPRSPMPDPGCRMPDAGCRMQDAGCRMPAASPRGSQSTRRGAAERRGRACLAPKSPPCLHSGSEGTSHPPPCGITVQIPLSGVRGRGAGWGRDTGSHSRPDLAAATWDLGSGRDLGPRPRQIRGARGVGSGGVAGQVDSPGIWRCCGSGGLV